MLHLEGKVLKGLSKSIQIFVS